MGISTRQFKQLQQRLARPRPEAVTEAPALRPPRLETIVLGVDPSLRGAGYGVVRLTRAHPAVLAQGTILCPAAWPRTRCLARIATTLREVIAQCRPTVAAVEGLFYAQNAKTALIMGEARGAALAVIAEAGLEIFEIAPRRAKLALVGHGGAQKLAVAKMVQRMLNLEDVPAHDAADALALALAWAQGQNGFATAQPRKI